MNVKQSILTITGSDGTGGSGIQADIRCISELGGTVTSVVTSITVQNTLGIQEFYDLPAPIVREQIEAIFNDLQPQVVKVGLMRNIEVVEVVAEMIRKYLVRMTREKGIGSLLISADLNEVLEVSDRLFVMRQGKIVAAFPKANVVDVDVLGEYMLGIRTMTAEEMEGLL